MKKKRVLEITFDYADAKGNLSVVDSNGFKFILLAEDFARDNMYYSHELKAKFIGLSLNCKISKIDAAAKTIYVVSATSSSDIKGGIIKDIFKELNAGRNPVLFGDILFVTERRVVVNILHKNVLGIINLSDWSPAYTRFLTAVAKKGDPVQFEVLGPAKRKKGQDIAFQLSRKNVIPDPWESLDDISVGSIITVKCIDKPVDKNYFWGISPHSQGIEIMCDYNPNLSILTGVYYKCKVRRFSKEERKFQVIPFEVVPSGIGTIENIEYVTSRVKLNKGV